MPWVLNKSVFWIWHRCICNGYAEFWTCLIMASFASIMPQYALMFLNMPDFSGCCDKVTITLPNLKDIIIKHWHILQADQSYKETFSMLPIIAFRKGTSLKQIIGTNTIHNNEKLIKTKNNHHTGKCVPCNSTHCLCCQQHISATTFKSN